MASIQEANYAPIDEEESEEEGQNPAQSQATQNTAKKKRKSRELTSDAWDDYTIVDVTVGEGA